MKIIYLELDGENIVGWGSQLDNAVQIEVEENHDFFTNFRLYKYVDGQLVKGEEIDFPVEKTELEKLNERIVLTEEAIDFLILNGGL